MECLLEKLKQLSKKFVVFEFLSQFLGEFWWQLELLFELMFLLESKHQLQFQLVIQMTLFEILILRRRLISKQLELLLQSMSWKEWGFLKQLKFE